MAHALHTYTVNCFAGSTFLFSRDFTAVSPYGAADGINAWALSQDPGVTRYEVMLDGKITSIYSSLGRRNICLDIPATDKARALSA